MKGRSTSSKTVFITGGSRGIGASCVRKFAASGWNVAFTYKEHKVEAEALVSEITDDPSQTPGKILAIHMDMGGRTEIEQGISHVLKYFDIKAFDAFVGNAGISRSGQIQDMSEIDVDELMGVNLESNMFISQLLTPGMVEAKSGSIVYISSIWGREGAAMESVYSATKAGLIGFAKSLAKELGPSGIRVNAVLPGVIDTDMNSAYTRSEIEAIIDSTPLGRLGNPDEVAEAVYFLTSDMASFITGQAIGVDGGAII